jgi:hypothetical protein
MAELGRQASRDHPLVVSVEGCGAWRRPRVVVLVVVVVVVVVAAARVLVLVGARR